jgi:hypothetical protein
MRIRRRSSPEGKEDEELIEWSWKVDVEVEVKVS